METWTENHGVSMASNYHFCYWCQSPRSDLMSSVFPPLSLQTIYTEQFLSCGPFRNRPCTRGCIADFFLVKENESKMVGSSCFQSGWRPYQDKKCTQGFGRLCALKIDRLEKSDFMAGFSCLIHRASKMFHFVTLFKTKP